MRLHPVRGLLGASLIALSVAILGGAASAGAPSPGDPVPTITPTQSETITPTPSERPSDAPGPTPTVDPENTDTPGSSGAPVWMLPLLGLVGVAIGLGGGYALSGRRSTGPVTPPMWAPTMAPPAPATSGGRGSGLPDGGRDELIFSVIQARDLAEPSSVMAGRLGAALAKAGVSEFAPVGEPYDVSRHFAVGTTPASDPSSADLIAEVQRVGYLSADRVIRPADVVVFRMEPGR